MTTAVQHISHEKSLTVAKAINGELEAKLKEGFIVLTVPTIQEVPAMHRLVVKVVKPEMEYKERKLISNDLYPQAGGSVAFRRNFYDKLAGAAGIQWVYHAFRRMDNGSNPRCCHYQAVGIIKGLDGQWVTKVGDKAIDMDVMEQELRDKCWERAQDYMAIAEDMVAHPASNPTDKQKLAREFATEFSTHEARARWVEEKVRPDALQIQKHIVARAQTGAMSRVVEKALSLKKSYSAKELEKGFVFASLVFTPDETNPIDRKFMLDEASGARSALYPAAPTPSHVAPEIPMEVMATNRMPDYTDTELEEAEVVHVQVKPADSSAPSKDEVLRADFKEANPKGQAEMLGDLIKSKGWPSAIDGNPATWTAQDRGKFLEVLLSRPDVEEAGKPKLPF